LVRKKIKQRVEQREQPDSQREQTAAQRALKKGAVYQLLLLMVLLDIPVYADNFSEYGYVIYDNWIH
jgi:hypothetical protein